MDSKANQVGTVVHSISVPDYCRQLLRGGKQDALSRRLEYHPKEGHKHAEQSIVKLEHFIVSLIKDKT